MKFNPRPGDLYICKEKPAGGHNGCVYLCCNRYEDREELFFVLFNSNDGVDNDCGECSGSVQAWGDLFNPRPIGNLRNVFEDLEL